MRSCVNYRTRPMFYLMFLLINYSLYVADVRSGTYGQTGRLGWRATTGSDGAEWPGCSQGDGDRLGGPAQTTRRAMCDRLGGPERAARKAMSDRSFIKLPRYDGITAVEANTALDGDGLECIFHRIVFRQIPIFRQCWK